MSYDKFIAQNIAPYAVQKIGVYNSSGVRVGHIPVTNLKPTFGTRLYRFGFCCDSHLGCTSSALAPDDLQRAYTFFNDKESVDFVVMCGDLTHNGTTAQFQSYQTIKNGYMANKTVYCICANHDNITPSNYTGDWTTYTGNSKNYVFTKNSGNDIFICLGSSTVNASSPLVDADITWIEQQLETYRNKRCFILFHYPFSDYSGNYSGRYGYNMQGTNYTQMKALLEHYPNCIWLSGHSHWDWKYQAEESNANIDRVANNGAWTVHVPSVAYPRQLVNNNAISDNNPGSQCCVVDVYDNYIDIRGLDYDGTSLKYIPIAQYRLDTTLKSVPSNYASVTNNLTHAANSNTATTIKKGTSYTATISASSGYTLDSVSVTMGGTNITSTAYSNGSISISNVTGDIVITASSSVALATFTITNNLTSVTNSNSATSITEGQSYSATLSAASGYKPSNVSVTMGGTNITSTVYSNKTITISNVTGNIVITATAVAITTTTVNLSWEPGYLTSSGGQRDDSNSYAGVHLVSPDFIPYDAETFSYNVTYNKTNNPAMGAVAFHFYNSSQTWLIRYRNTSITNGSTECLSDWSNTNAPTAKYIKIMTYHNSAPSVSANSSDISMTKTG